jgi:hypothetical protein
VKWKVVHVVLLPIIIYTFLPLPVLIPSEGDMSRSDGSACQTGPYPECPRPPRAGGLAQGGASYQPETTLGEYRVSHRFVENGMVYRFKKYLGLTKKYKFILDGNIKGIPESKTIEYVHRWTKLYQDSILSKFYQIDKFMRENPGVVTMLTLTVYQGSKSRYNDGSYSRKIKGHDLSIFESLDLLKKSRKKLINVLRNRHPGMDYVQIMEGHPETGWAHSHLTCFKEFTEKEKEKIKKLWSEKYEAGSYGHGVKLEAKNSEESIRSLKNYLMKYMASQFGVGDTEWTPQEWLFNALMWETKTRMWSSSKNITAIMRRPDKATDFICNSVTLRTPGADTVIWERETGDSFPDLSNVENIPNDDDLAPEGWATRERWKRRYWSERKNHSLEYFDKNN